MEPQAHLRRLLEAYQAVAMHAAATPHVAFLQRSSGFLGRFVWLPRPSWLTKYFAVQHIRRRLDELERRLSARAAFADDRARFARELEMLADFRRSLPPTVSRRLLIFLSILATLLLTRLLSQWAFDLSRPDDKAEMKLLVELEDSLLSFNVRGGLLDEIATAPLHVMLDLLSGLVLCGYAVLRCAYPGFRLKRVVFNCYPALPEGRNWGRMREHVGLAKGLYALETEIFEALDARRTREFPFDLVVSSLVASLWTGIGIASFFGSDQEVGSGMFLVGSGLLWLAWLARAWRRRERRNPTESETHARQALAV